MVWEMVSGEADDVCLKVVVRNRKISDYYSELSEEVLSVISFLGITI